TITGPGGLDCGGAGHTACTVEVTPSASITLTAHPGADAYTASWSGCAPVTVDTCTLDVSGNQSYAAGVTFERNPRTLHVTPAGTGGGTVTGPGIDCGGGPTHGDCVELLSYGTMATLTATPAANSDFAGFSGGGCAGSPCTVTMSSDATVTTTFGLKQRTLWVLPIGSGTATITGPGIDCGPPGHDDCSEPFPDGTAVELTVTLAPGTQLAGMVGGGCAASPCTVTVTADTTVLAVVSPVQRTLGVTGDGSGAGYVDSSPAGIDCGRGVAGHAACVKDYDNGTVVTLTAHPAAGSAFFGFTGEGCPARTTTCTVTMGEARAVTATFGTARTLTVVRAGSGGGTVSGAGIACGSDCAEVVGDGSKVVLTATPEAGSEFLGFSGGGCAGSAATCTMVLGADATVTATFAVRPPAAPAGPSGSVAPSVLGALPTTPAGVAGSGSPQGTTAPPSNAFTLTRTRVKKAARSIALTLRLPGPGTLKVTASRYPSKTVKVLKAGTTTITLKPSRKVKASLIKAKRSKVKVKITYIPAGGSAAAKAKTVTV
ncbi:MAG TPA: hypothetical protein VNT55_13190, partial [Baekduia sp.]|nr:hypothetical protein [Baekduia sp.]